MILEENKRFYIRDINMGDYKDYSNTSKSESNIYKNNKLDLYDLLSFNLEYNNFMYGIEHV